ncbi:ABC-F family ATP-binding cassette domain-containing protein [Penaeicola halotolerans]|uniref:ABC-F family ATP-binding cassette domain-containing protein n=1 Tax=Penaeicola halotolerans TaxID=2793196 RepID=UPI001CF88331|nr:ABC-F family ATP-binding cassette domain-containing protein [Penaeicola halotolerans]
MNYLSVETLSKAFGDKVLFQNISFGIDQGQKIALVGINGSGKSTLMKIIMGLEESDAGSVTFRNDIKVTFVHQNPTFADNQSVAEAVFYNSDDPVLQTIREYQLTLIKSETDLDAQDQLTGLFEKMDTYNAWDYESQVKQILGRLGIHDLEQPISQLSGGQRKRVALAKALVEKPDLMIMDEPTNHLDLETIEWLENYLSTANLSLLLVTHDRYFLEKVTNEILELDNGGIYRYKGNYAYFLEKKADREMIEASEIDKAKNLYRKELDWIRRQPKARGTKAKYRVDAFEDTKDKAFSAKKKDSLELSVAANRMGGKIIEIEHLQKKFGDKKIVNDFSYVFKKQDRIGIIGPNGAGKTTFLNMLTGKLAPDAGMIEAGKTINFGYYRQEDDSFDPNQRIIDMVKEIAEVVTMANGSVITASQFLNHFQFSPKAQYTPIGKLSGGEKRRLQLLKILIKSPNFLILDEPTNDLDLITLNILEDFLANFPGCIILVSHDRYFMDRLVDHLFVFDGEGEINDFPGNYTDYREWEKEQTNTPMQKDDLSKAKESTAPISPKVEVSKTKASYKEKREYQTIQEDMAKLDEERATYIDKLNSGSGSHEDLLDWSQKVEAFTQKIDAMELRWLELSELEGIED